MDSKLTQEGGEFKAEQVYANKVIVNHHGGVVLVATIFTATATTRLEVLELKTGVEKWKNPASAKARSLSRTECCTCARKAREPSHWFRRHRKSTNLVSEFDQPERSDAQAWPHPVVAGGKLYIRDQDKLFCYDIKQK